MDEQSFTDTTRSPWATPDFLSGVELLSLAVLTGVVYTGSTRCQEGIFWHTPGGIRQGPHVAESDATILTIGLGEMGPFDSGGAA